jgi:DNA processing protein
MIENPVFKLALSMIPGIGGVLARNLIAYTGSIEAIFREPLKNLVKIPGIGEVNARRIRDKEYMTKAETELQYIVKNNITLHFYTDKNYPRRLKACADGPILFFSRGKIELDEQRVVSVVGTRNATEYGKKLTEGLIDEFAKRNYKILIVSGLAYGIDIMAHRAAIKHKLQTVAVLGHGLDKIYPSLHADVARKMEENGGLVTDFPSKTKIDPQNFIRRNRIVAGLSDATIVVESAEKGGALITADIAGSYNRDVFAFPGRAGDVYSKGCNQLIRSNSANLIEGINDIEFFMGWEETQKKSECQPRLFLDLTIDEERVVALLSKNGEMFIDQLSTDLEMPVSKVSALLLNMEFRNLIVALPGKMYKIR